MRRSPGRIPPSPDDDDFELMALFRALPEDDVEDLLAGGAPASPAAGGLADLVAVLRADAPRHGAPPMSAELRAQIAAFRPSPAPSRRRRVVAGGVLGIVFGTSVLGVAGAQNVLPAVIQDAASSAADVVGIHLPRADERDDDTNDGDEVTDTTPDGADPQGEGSQGQGSKDPGDKGPQGTTPGGATPADPGTPGDKEPAVPADPATGNGTGNGNGNGQGNGAGNGQGNGTENGQGNGAENGQGNGAQNGQGTGGTQGRGTGQP